MQTEQRPADPFRARVYDHYRSLGVEPAKAREVVDNTFQEG